MVELRSTRMRVTAGAGFLGRHAAHFFLCERECTEVMVPRRPRNGLAHEAAVERPCHAARPRVAVHLAATPFRREPEAIRGRSASLAAGEDCPDGSACMTGPWGRA